jgi:hypothetical protein
MLGPESSLVHLDRIGADPLKLKDKIIILYYFLKTIISSSFRG